MATVGEIPGRPDGTPGAEPLVPRVLPAVLVGAALVSAVIVTLGAPLIPLVQTTFGLSPEQAQWSYTITLLVAAACTPVLGRLADGRHRKAVTVLVCVLVAGGCVASATAASFPVFLVGRGLQGLSVALVAMSIAAARAHLPAARAGSTVAMLSITTALGAGISYPLSTAIADHWGMSAAFGCAAVVVAISGIAVSIWLPTASAVPRTRPDVFGAALLMSGVTLFLLAITHGNAWGWTSVGVLAPVAVAAALVYAWVRWEGRVEDPLVRIPLLRDRRVLAADVVALLIGMCLYSTPVLVSRLAQLPTSTGYGAGLSLTQAGAIMIPIAFGNLLGSRVRVWARAIGGPRFALAFGGLVAMSGALVLATVPISVPTLILAMALTSTGAGATFGSMPALIISAVPGSETGSAMSFNLLLRTVGGSIGSAATAAALGAFMVAGDEIPPWAGFRAAFLLSAFVCLAAAVSAVVLVRPTRRS